MNKSLLLFLLVLALAACGGGGGGGSGNVAPPIQQLSNGFWVGPTNTGRTTNTVTMDTGAYWSIYTSEGNSAVTAGFVQGNRTTSGSNITSTDLRDFNFEGAGLLTGSMSGSYVTAQSIKFTVTYTGGADSTETSGTYNADYSTTPSLATLAGTYTGETGTLQGVDFTTATITATGEISGSSSGCSFTGTADTHSPGNIYDVRITFGGSPCELRNTQVTGIAYFESGTNLLYIALVDAGRNNGVLFIGEK